MSEKNVTTKSRVWDLPVRLFHVLLIALVAFNWWTGEEMQTFTFGENQYFTWHIWSGCSILALVLFRIVWGFVGSTTARFSHFVKGPVTVLRYVAGLFSRKQKHVGHNPLGGWSVLLLLGFLLVMPILGLMAYEDTFFLEGPLRHLVDKDTAETFGGLHHELWEILIILLGIHVAASIFYLIVKRQNLIGPMVTGRTTLEDAETQEAETLRFRPLWLAFLILLATSGLVVLAVTQL